MMYYRIGLGINFPRVGGGFSFEIRSDAIYNVVLRGESVDFFRSVQELDEIQVRVLKIIPKIVLVALVLYFFLESLKLSYLVILSLKTALKIKKDPALA